MRERQAQREAEEQNLRRQMMETGPRLSHAASRHTGSTQSDPAMIEEQQQQASVRPPSPLYSRMEKRAKQAKERSSRHTAVL